jgi:hypothetical protein
MTHEVDSSITLECGHKPSTLARIPHELSLYRQVIIGVEINVLKQREGAEDHNV